MKRFFILMAIIFGFLLTYQVLMLSYQQKDMSKVDTRQFKDKVLKVAGIDLFAEKNINDIFTMRYGAGLKYNIVNNFDDYLPLKTGYDVAIYPSFAYSALITAGMLSPVDHSKVPNTKSLMENFTKMANERFSENNKLYAFPIAYIPQAVFFNTSKIKPNTSGKILLSESTKIALSDDFNSFLTLLKIFNLPVKSRSVKELKKILDKKSLVFFKPENLDEMVSILTKEKPDSTIAPIYLKSFYEREFGSLEIILPDEGTYATMFLLSPLKTEQVELSHIYINHITDPIFHKKIAEVMSMPITNKLAMNKMAPTLYNTFKMNAPEYIDKMIILKDEKEFKQAQELYKEFRQ